MMTFGLVVITYGLGRCLQVEKPGWDEDGLSRACPKVQVKRRREKDRRKARLATLRMRASHSVQRCRELGWLLFIERVTRAPLLPCSSFMHSIWTGG